MSKLNIEPYSHHLSLALLEKFDIMAINTFVTSTIISLDNILNVIIYNSLRFVALCEK